MSTPVQLTDVKFDTTIYPRSDLRQDTVEEYVDALKRGDIFPPLVLEEETNRLLDGRHRWQASKNYLRDYKKAEEDKRIDWTVPSDTIEVEYHVVPEGIPHKLYAARLSARHGLRISASDRRALAREIYKADSSFNTITLGEYLGVSKSRAHDYIRDLMAANEEERNAIIYKLSYLGWTQEEIAEKVGLAQSVVSEILSKFPVLEKPMKNQYESGTPVDKLATRNNWSQQLVYAIGLADKPDLEKMKDLNISIQPYTVWNFAGCDDRFGSEYPGRIPGQLVAHTLYFYSEPGDVILDPMAGSGTTVDVCLTMGRKCYAYDIKPFEDRLDIIEHDLNQGWPDRIKKANLIFWDAPYYKKKADDYPEGSISDYSEDEYSNFFKKSFKEAYDNVNKGTRLCFLMSSYDVEGTDDTDPIFIWDYAQWMKEAGWTLTRSIMTPISTQQVNGATVTNYRENKKLARLERYLIVGEK